MTLLTVVKDVCATVGVQVPQTVFGGIANNRTMQEMLALANEMGQRIAYDTRDWTTLKVLATFPGDGVHTDDEILHWARQYGGTVWHLIGTCRMGPAADKSSVVSDELKVHGLENLRVIDASIMPTITSGNTNAPTIMIAEKGADMVRADRKVVAAA